MTGSPNAEPAWLLDANALIALGTVNHIHHLAVAAWQRSRPGPWATCPSTQGSLIRFAVREGATGPEAVMLLESLTAHPDHSFWPDDLGYVDVDLQPVIGHRQVTDAYLASACRRRGARLATLDRGLVAVHPDIAELIPT